jgi:hypothetical protein
MPIAALGAALAVGWTLVQLIPLPCSWVTWAQPERAEVLAELAVLGVVDAERCTLSMAPGATLGALAHAMTLCALLVAASAVSRAGERETLLHAVALSSILMALVALAHLVFALDQVFGLYAPRGAKPGLLLAPLLNANHLAGHLALGLPLCLSFGLSGKRLDVRIVWLAAAFVVLATGMLTLSRAGICALVGGAGACLFMHARKSWPKVSGTRAAVVAAGATLLIGLASVASIDLVAREFHIDEQSFGKLGVMRSLLGLVVAHPFAGVGRGALGDVSPSVVAGNVRVPQAENLPLQWAVEWGVPIAATLLLAIVCSVLALRLRRAHDWALAAGLAALCLQNLVDFSLELAGVSCVAAVAFGSLLGRERPEALPWLPRPRLSAATLATAIAAVAATIWAAPSLTSRSKDSFTRTLTALSETRDPAFLSTLAQAFRGYPMEPMFVVLAATQAVKTDQRVAPRWLNLAMSRAPEWTAPHALAAYHLERRGQVDQAAIELSMVLERQPEHGWTQTCGLLQRHPSASVAHALLPPRSRHAAWIADHVASCLVRSGAADAEDFVITLGRDYPRSAFIHTQLIYLALRRKDERLAINRAWAMLRALPEEPASTAALINTLVQTGHADEALLVLNAAKSGVRAARGVLVEGLSAAAMAKRGGLLQELANELIETSATTTLQAEAQWVVSTRYEWYGSLDKAIAHAQLSYERSGDPTVLERVHALAMRAGIARVALRAAAELCHVRHQGDSYCAESRGP